MVITSQVKLAFLTPLEFADRLGYQGLDEVRCAPQVQGFVRSSSAVVAALQNYEEPEDAESALRKAAELAGKPAPKLPAPAPQKTGAAASPTAAAAADGIPVKKTRKGI